MDVEYLGPISTTSGREEIQHLSRVEEIDEDKIQKMYISQNSIQADRETISYANPLHSSILIPQTTMGLSEYQSQQGRMGHLCPLGIQNDWINQNVKINPRKEIKKLSQEEKNLAILSENGKLYCPTSLTNSKWSFTDQLGLKLNQKIQKYCRIAQKKWSNFMKKQTSNLKEMTAAYFALHHFLPIIKKSRYKNILIRTDNTATTKNQE
jgi:hypothetical protein